MRAVRIAPPRPRDNGAYMYWSAPATNGAPITAFVVRAYHGTRCIKSVTVKPGLIRYTVVPGLKAGVSYTFTVTAKNALGYGPTSRRSAPVRPY